MVAAIGIFALVGYLIGSVNFAVVVARRHGVDILKEGSGNPGATNVKRVLGKGPGNLVFALDALKGFVGAGLPHLLLQIDEPAGAADLLFLVGVAGFVGTLLGHCFSCFLGFRGGKGVASTIGGLLVLLPIPILVGAAVWGLVFAFSRYVSLASLALGVSLPLACWLLPLAWPGLLPGLGQPQFWFAAALAVFNVWSHRANLRRLLAGTESRFIKTA